MGNDCTVNAASLQVHRTIMPLGERQREMADAGLDPSQVEIVQPGKYTNGWKKCCSKLSLRQTPSIVTVCLAFPCLAAVNIAIEVASVMGTDCSANSLSLHINGKIQPFGQRQLEMRNAGLDPKDIEIVLPDKYTSGRKKCCSKLSFLPESLHC